MYQESLLIVNLKGDFMLKICSSLITVVAFIMSGIGCTFLITVLLFDYEPNRPYILCGLSAYILSWIIPTLLVWLKGWHGYWSLLISLLATIIFMALAR